MISVFSSPAVQKVALAEEKNAIQKEQLELSRAKFERDTTRLFIKWAQSKDALALYDTKTAQPVTPEESRRRAFDKDAWDRNYGCLFITGGSAAVGLIKLMEAMERGERAGCVYAENDLPPGWERLFDLSKGPVGIGADPATTEGEKSNPFGIAVTQRIGFGIRRAAIPQSPMLPFSGSQLFLGRGSGVPEPPVVIPLSVADSVEDRPAATRADDLARAFATDLAPIQSVIAASTSPEDCIRRVEAWISQHNPANAADVIEKALYVYSMASARSAQRPKS